MTLKRHFWKFIFAINILIVLSTSKKIKWSLFPSLAMLDHRQIMIKGSFDLRLLQMQVYLSIVSTSEEFWGSIQKIKHLGRTFIMLFVFKNVQFHNWLLWVLLRIKMVFTKPNRIDDNKESHTEDHRKMQIEMFG